MQHRQQQKSGNSGCQHSSLYAADSPLSSLDGFDADTAFGSNLWPSGILLDSGDLPSTQQIASSTTISGSMTSQLHQSLDISPTFGCGEIESTACDDLESLKPSSSSIISTQSAWCNSFGLGQEILQLDKTMPTAATWTAGTEQVNASANSTGRHGSRQMKVLLENLEPQDVEALVSGFWSGRSHAKLTMWNDDPNE